MAGRFVLAETNCFETVSKLFWNCFVSVSFQLCGRFNNGQELDLIYSVHKQAEITRIRANAMTSQTILFIGLNKRDTILSFLQEVVQHIDCIKLYCSVLYIYLLEHNNIRVQIKTNTIERSNIKTQWTKEDINKNANKNKTDREKHASSNWMSYWNTCIYIIGISRHYRSAEIQGNPKSKKKKIQHRQWSALRGSSAPLSPLSRWGLDPIKLEHNHVSRMTSSN